MNETYENNKNDFLTEDKLYVLPKNIRQIGDVGDGDRIYIEDYVYTYLHQYASEEKTTEQIAFLVGKKYLYNEESILLVNGALQAKELEKVHGNLHLTEETWKVAYDEVKAYFNGLSIVGWMYTQPGYGILLTSFLNEHHKEHFMDPKQVLYIIDPLEKEDAIFVLKENDLFEKKGYYIFYDKNQKMHQYMLKNRVVRTEDNEATVQKDIVRTFRRREQQRKEEMYQKKFVNMLTLVIGGLVCVCLVLGVGLLSNMDKVNKLQSSLKTLSESLDNVNDTQNAEVMAVDDKKIGDNQNNDVPDNSKPDSSNENEHTNDGKSNDNNADVDEEETTDTTAEIKPVINVPETYIIKAGDNLNTISVKYYNTKEMVPKIQELNGIENPNKVYVGQEIKLPRP